MADRKRCVNLTCNNIALFHKKTLCQKHYSELKGDASLNWQTRKPLKPTSLNQWEWIKKELNL